MAPVAMVTTLSCTAPTTGRIAHPWISKSRISARQINVWGRKYRRALSFRVIGAAQNPTSVDPGGETERARKSLQHLAETLVLPPGFLSTLPNDLKVDLKDAAFALSKGPINQECGVKVGEVVMGLSRAWEQADTQAVAALANEVPSLQENLPSDPLSNTALGKRLHEAGRYLAATGQYGNGELQKISKALLAAGEVLSEGNPDPADKALPKESGRIFKFGDVQVQLTSQNAYIGAAIAFGFGVLCWKLTSGFQNTTLDAAQYANDSSFSLALSLRGALLTAGYSCTALSAIAMAGLLALGAQVGTKDTS